MRKSADRLRYAPSDLITFLASPFASWMDRYHLEYPGAAEPDERTEDDGLIAKTGARHEQAVLEEFRTSDARMVEITTRDFTQALTQTKSAVTARTPVIYQAALEEGDFSGFADFLLLDPSGDYQVWDTKLARSPKPYYAIQLCCYSEMLASITGVRPDTFGVILGNGERVPFKLESFVYYYRHLKQQFLMLQAGFTGDLHDRPEPAPRADHGRWTSHADRFFRDRDHLVMVAGITTGQIKKLLKAGLTTAAQLADASSVKVANLDQASLDKLAAQARLQRQTIEDRLTDPEAPPRFEILPHAGPNGEAVGFAALPPDDPGDVWFDMEGYPLAPGGLEYLFGCCTREPSGPVYRYWDWWAHDRDGEKRAFEEFVDWAFDRWKKYPRMHIYHYAPYEPSAIRRLSTRHDSRQDEVDELLRRNVFVDLFRIVRQGLRVGADNYSIKSVERLYRPKRATEVASGADSIVAYSRWIESGQAGDWRQSAVLKNIRDYNEDDCRSTAELLDWMRALATTRHLLPPSPRSVPAQDEPRELPQAVIDRIETVAQLRKRRDSVALTLADLVEFHRREQKPVWWRMFDRAAATPDQLRDDPGCIEGLTADGPCSTEKRSLLQAYRFDPAQECRLAASDQVRFVHNLDATFTIADLDAAMGRLTLKIGRQSLGDKCGGVFPTEGSLLQNEFVSPAGIPDALARVAASHLSDTLPKPVTALLTRQAPAAPMQQAGESTIDAALRIARSMDGGCLVVQGPPGTGKTYAASRVIVALLERGKRIGIASNSHKAIINLVKACGEALGPGLKGVKAGGELDRDLHEAYPGLLHVASNNDAKSRYVEGLVGGTAWLFTRDEWIDTLDYLFIDEAGQVPLANAVAMAGSARNLVLLGDQMQLEQPIQGSHPGDAGLSVLQYALKDEAASLPDAPVFHAVVPPDYGLFLGESRRMHPSVCRFISESIYETRLTSHPDCARQRIEANPVTRRFVGKEAGLILSPVEHDGNVLRSDEEIIRVQALYRELLGRPYTDKHGKTRPLALADFLFIAPYNAQVRALQDTLPAGARVGSVDKFQGQEAPVCILSLCSSYGEYGSRGLAFILDRNRINVAVSRAQCLAVVVADPRIACSFPGSVKDMMLLNLFCKLADASAGD
ncbi:conserved protein of unknown function [Nitrospira japonica]|uniref:Helicase n=1 Tax=Nitrospira japonica TaxID=1325564 RepID=A0A1W1I8T1_9BACT|nr:TM0106 family RecB-like putative nuclease [Nitrospira japonica]SLM49395.1 conserved protein of unknown function [Nitrospira japonica]